MRALLVALCAAALLILGFAAIANSQATVSNEEILPNYTDTLDSIKSNDCSDRLCASNAECVFVEGEATCKCLPGYEGDGNVCLDINECALAVSPCDANALCQNTPGSYSCYCKDGFEGDGKVCTLSREGTFPAFNEQEPKAEEPAGIFLELRGGDVITIDQLEARMYVDPGWKVRRRGGDLIEAEVYYDIPAALLAGEVGTYVIPYHATDEQGNEADPKTRRVQVVDVDECALGIHTCSIHADCHNTDGGYTCTCKPGFVGDGFKCTDINECKTGTHECSPHARCENTQGGYICICEDGYEGDGKTCYDIDECKRGTHRCDEHAICTNTEGSYTCTCQEGYEGDGFVCKLKDSCEHGTHDCDPNATCIKTDETPEGYRCVCNKGFVGSGRNCVDIDECETGAYDCPTHSTCVNTIGSYDCVCEPGFERADDGYSCVDIDECKKEIDDCSPHATCTNTVGSYECTCKDGYVGNGKVCTPILPPTDIILRGDNPMIMKQCDAYKEESFMLVDPKKETLRVTVTMPPALMDDLVMKIGTHIVQYHVTDQGQHKATVVRNVTVTPINPCVLPEGHPCRHKCHPYAKCIPDQDDSAGYRCECTDGFETLRVDGTTICKDNVPPIIRLRGPEVVILRACRMCKWYDPGETYDEDRHGGYYAFDPLPDDNRIDLTDKVVITNETVVADKEWRIYYNVVDWAGNKAATQVRVVRKEVEDVLRRIENVESFLHQKFAEFDPYPKKIDFITSWAIWIGRILLFVLGTILLVVLLPRFWNLFKVTFSSNRPTYEEFVDGYELWYAITRPYESVAARQRRAAVEYQRRYNDKY